MPKHKKLLQNNDIDDDNINIQHLNNKIKQHQQNKIKIITHNFIKNNLIHLHD
jgi:hypothetical protein